MSVLCSRIPHLALTLAARHQPDLVKQPVAILGRDNEVLDLSTPAYHRGVRMGMNARQAKMHCPQIKIVEADVSECQRAQNGFLDELGKWEVPVEPHGLGMAYVDMREVAKDKEEAIERATDLGRRVRGALGDDAPPSLGLNHSMFCARAAAYHSQPGQLKYVSKKAEKAFLAPLPISYLPLPPPAIQRLHWYGINTLGQFAEMPAAAVFQHFGKEGQLAQRWAQGKDNRPVKNYVHAAWSPLEVEFEVPTEQLPMVVDAVMAKLEPHLDQWAEELRGCTRLRLELYFTNRERRILDLTWIMPVTQPARVRSHIANQLAALNWPGALDRLVITQAATAEQPVLQLSLFDEPLVESVSLEEIVAPLKHRYGPIFMRGLVIDETHPEDERRVQKQAL